MEGHGKSNYRIQDAGLGQARRPSMGPILRIRIQCRSKIGNPESAEHLRSKIEDAGSIEDDMPRID